MKRSEFLIFIISFIIKMSVFWLAEEAPGEDYVDAIIKKLDEHRTVMKKIVEVKDE